MTIDTDGALALIGNDNPYGPAAFGVPVFVSQLNCVGNENATSNCGFFFSSDGISGCAHDQDSAVSCQIRSCELCVCLYTLHTYQELQKYYSQNIRMHINSNFSAVSCMKSLTCVYIRTYTLSCTFI